MRGRSRSALDAATYYVASKMKRGGAGTNLRVEHQIKMALLVTYSVALCLSLYSQNTALLFAH